jgi:predicted Rossmann fold flavoprotein
LIAVIGAGAAGLMAAIHASGGGEDVVLLERTADGGRKILISGGGRCNVLPSELDERRFVTDSSPNTLKKMLRAWPLGEQRAFFETTLGIPLELEPESGKLFPRSNRARDVRDRLVSHARATGTTVRFGALVRGLEPAPGGWTIGLGGGDRLDARAVIVTTGGLSVPATGSDGWGLDLARRLGHSVNPTYPALTPLTAAPAVHAELAGVSLPVTARGGTVTSRGGFLFTHRGYSGPAVLDLSHVQVRALGPIRIRWSDEDWEARLRSPGAGTVVSTLRASLPARLAERLLLEAGIESGRELSQLTRAERAALVGLLEDYPLPATGNEGYRKAEVTGGGVALSEVDPRTLESRRHPGLFFAGEVLDAFGPIGGYNFAWAWATGRAAGLGARRRA